MKRFALTASLAIALTSIGVDAQAQVTPQLPSSVGRFTTRLTSASPTTCTSIEVGAGFLVELINSGPALTTNPQYYDEGASPTCAAADLVYGDGTVATQMQAGQIILLTLPMKFGIAVKITGGALPSTNNLIITRI